MKGLKKYNDLDRELRIRYKGMMSRCYNENSCNYKWYGGKGIAVCDEWRNDFLNFRDWALENGYSKELTLDRIDGEKDYCPENCRWITWERQQNNKSNNHIVIINGEQYSMSDASKKLNMNYFALRSHLRRHKNVFNVE